MKSLVRAHAMDLKKAEFTVNVNVMGTVRVCKAATGLMVKTKSPGSIVLTSSCGALTGNAGGTIYAATKAFVINFTKNLALEYGENNIRVNCICPGFVPGTNFYPATFTEDRKNAQNQIIAIRDLEGNPVVGIAEYQAAAMYLISDECPWTTGIIMPVDGGQACGNSPRMNAWLKWNDED